MQQSPRLFFCKISERHPEQLTRNFFAGGNENSIYYGGIRPGDYVFPISQGKIKKLWQVREFSYEPNEISGTTGAVYFDVVREYQDAVSIFKYFVRNRWFEINLTLINKSAKSVKGQSFFEITLAPGSPLPEQIDLFQCRNFYIVTVNSDSRILFNDGDIRVLIDNLNELRILDIEEFSNGNFSRYVPLYDLYLARNPTNERYSIIELCDFTNIDNAPNKRNYLEVVIDHLRKFGYFEATKPVALYDNLLVGRRRTIRRDTTNQGQISVNEVNSIDETDTEADLYSEFSELLDFNPNLILYGPPGTGKTYVTKFIIEHFANRNASIFKSFEDLRREGRVEFVTFHQSFSYEEFVEGLRPVIYDSTTETEVGGGNNLQYEIKKGVLKEIANRAALSQLQQEFRQEGISQISESSTIWKISLGSRRQEEHIYQDCIDSNYIAIGWLSDRNLQNYDKTKVFEELSEERMEGEESPINAADSVNNFINVMEIGDLVLVFESRTSIRAIGVVKGDYYWDNSEEYAHKRKVEWLKVFNEPVNILKYNGGVQLTHKTLYNLWRFKFADIHELLKEHSDTSQGQKKVRQNVVAQPYFLVIDEINRGNISKIFGELITLIEKDKRDTLYCSLPYSQKPFTLPSNLFFIGTMNTADRSIAVLDTALRRRFVFKELEPDPQLLESEAWEEKEINLVDLLTKLNEKITNELDRNHRIGHAYFIGLVNIKHLRLVWYNQVIPLLMEYFYNDGVILERILGASFIEKETCHVNLLTLDSEFKAALQQI